MPTELSSGATTSKQTAGVTSRVSRRRMARPDADGWTSRAAAETLAGAAPYASRRIRRMARGSARIRRTTVVFRALLTIAMVVAVTSIVLEGLGSAGSPDPTSPDAPPPSVFVQPAD